MICCMIGSQFFGILMSKNIKPEVILRNTFIISAFSLFLVNFDEIFNTNFKYFGFLIFEICVGIYFPCQSMVKGKIVPEETRSTIYNLFRVS